MIIGKEILDFFAGFMHVSSSALFRRSVEDGILDKFLIVL